MTSAQSQKLHPRGEEVWRRIFGQTADRGKLRSMALLGAVGCLAGALCAELFFSSAPRPSDQEKQICLLLDCSGSMFRATGLEQGMTKLEEVKIAANRFIARQNLTNERLAMVGFGSDAHTGAALSADKARLQLAVDLLSDGGGTNMSAGLLRASSELPGATGNPAADKTERSILLFTDGQPEDKISTLNAARACREQNIRIVAIGAGDADMTYLAQVTGDPHLVFPASAGSFGESFQKAEKALHRGSLVESGASERGFWKSLGLPVAWTALLAVGISLALITGQNLYLCRPLLGGHELLIGGLGGLGAGAVAGIVGQGIFSMATAVADVPAIATISPLFVFVGRIVGWLILGALVGRGLAFFIPNLASRNAWIGGAIGGALGGLAFVLASLAGDTVGRLVGSAILGALIGMMLAVAEAVSRRAWLEVYFGKNESVRVTLGPNLVKVGSDSRACAIYARGARPLAMGYRFTDNRVECIDYATEQSKTVAAGDKREIGAVTLVVCTSAHESTATSTDSPSVGKRPLPAPAPPSAPASRSPTSPETQPSTATTPKAPVPTSGANRPANPDVNRPARGIADSPVSATMKPPPPTPPSAQKPPAVGDAPLPSSSPPANRVLRPINPPPPQSPPPKPIP